MDREFIAERQKGLQNYLNVITTNHILSNCELVKKFLDPNNYSTNYTGKQSTGLAKVTWPEALFFANVVGGALLQMGRSIPFL